MSTPATLTGPAVTIVIPTVGRPSLIELLHALAAGHGPIPTEVIVVDDRPAPGNDLFDPAPGPLADVITVVPSGGRGPAAARNRGWQAAATPWVAFLDDDVHPPPDWRQQLVDDLDGLPDDVAASQGRIVVPLPTDRRPTDWERNVAGLQEARWATADMVYRRDVLAAVGGFDERFPRAYREDADLGLRVTGAGHRIVRGRRHVLHPVRATDDWVSVRMQAGNADDPFMRVRHGRGWRDRAGVPPGRRPWHLATTAAGLTAVAGALTGHRRLAAIAATTWTGLTADFARRRIAPGPRDAAELHRMTLTSLVLPAAATWHWVRGWVSLPRRLRQPPRRPAALLFDRDGTLVVDVPYNGDPDLVQPVDGARRVLDRVRRLGIPTGVVTNQSGIARGLLTHDDVEQVRGRIEQVLGPLGPWVVCPHGPDDGCACRKPAPGMVEQAAAELGVHVAGCVLIGDTGADVDAALAAGARGILVPNGRTRAEEVRDAPEVAPDLEAAIELALRPRPEHGE